MPKTFTAPFAQTPKTGVAITTLAVSSLQTDTPTGTVLLATAGTEGAILTRLFVMPRGSMSANVLLLFLSKDNGATMTLIDSESMAQVTTGLPETAFSNYSEQTPLRLAAGDRLYVGVQAAISGGVAWRAEWTDF